MSWPSNAGCNADPPTPPPSSGADNALALDFGPMGWDFETEPEYQEKLDWVDRFMRDDVEPLDYVLGDAYDKTDQRALAVVRPLQQQVRDQGLWAAHLKPEMGGQGYGQVKLDRKSVV